MPTSSEVSTRLTADNSQFRSVMNETERVADRAGKSIFKKLDLRAGMFAVAAAIGLNINSIAEKAARVWLGFSKEQEESLEKLVESTRRAADAQVAQLERARAAHEKNAQARADNVQRERTLVLDAIAESERQEMAAKEAAAKLESEAGFAADLAWVKEQDRIAASKKLKEKALVELHQLEMANEAEAARVEQARIDEKFKSLVDQWTGFQVLITSSGRGDRELSDRELERKAANIRQQIFQSEQGRVERIGVGNLTGAGGFDVINQQNLAGAQGELNLRRNVRRTAATQGEDAAFNQFSGLTEQRFADILKGATDQSQLLTAIDKLSKKFDQPLKTIDVSQASPFG